MKIDWYYLQNYYQIQFSTNLTFSGCKSYHSRDKSSGSDSDRNVTNYEKIIDFLKTFIASVSDGFF